MPTYLYEYEHGGSRWSLELEAPDQADAEARVASIRRSLEYSGLLVAELPGDTPMAVVESFVAQLTGEKAGD